MVGAVTEIGAVRGDRSLVEGEMEEERCAGTKDLGRHNHAYFDHN